MKKYILHGPEVTNKFPHDMTIGQLLFQKLKEHGTQVAQVQVETGEQLTYDEIFHKSCQLAIYFKQIGIQINDRIAICSENNLGWAVPLCAALFVGATVCPLNPSYSRQEFLHSVNISKPKYIFVSPKVLEIVKKFTSNLVWSPVLTLMINHPCADENSIDQLIKKIPISSVDNFRPTNCNKNDHIMAILYSSGTTGLPKGVMLTENNYLTTIQSLNQIAFLNPRNNLVLLCVLPMFHSYAFTFMFLSLVSGYKNILFSQFKEKIFLETIEKEKIEILNLVPPLMLFLAKHPIIDKYDLSSVKTIWCGAAPLSRDVENAVKKRLNITDVKQGYGMTESTLTVLSVPNLQKKAGSVGKLNPGCSGKVILCDDSGKWSNETLGPNCEGELCFKSDTIMKGYCDDEKSTSQTIDQDGWLHTGDIGYYDTDGYFYIVDRLKELIKYNGFQVPPAELEAILLTHAEIKDAAVIGLPDEKAGELPFAFVVKQSKSQITANDVIKYVNDQVSNPKKLRGGVRFVEVIPRNQSGKILRRELRQVLKSKL